MTERQESDDDPTTEKILAEVKRRQYFPDSQENYIRLIVRDEVKEFLPAQKITADRQETIEGYFARLGMPVDKFHIDDTAKTVRRIMFWSDVFSRLQMTTLLGLGTAAIVYIAKLIGIHLPWSPGGE